MEDVLVGVLCYNHEEYIAQCLESVLRQKCSFNYTVYVFDDVSTDNSWSIILDYKEKYGDKLIIEQPIKNTFSQGNRNGFLQHLTKVKAAKYVAFCEADDYWTDENKLQKQYDAMQASDDASICVHDVEFLDVLEGKNMGVAPGNINAGWTQKELVMRILSYKLSIRLNSYFIRTNILHNENMYNEFWDYWAPDLALLVFAMLKGKLIYLNENMAVKRVNNSGSLSHQANVEIDICPKYIRVFEEDLKWIDCFNAVSGGEYKELVDYYKQFRHIKLYYLYRGKGADSKLISTFNGRVYKCKWKRKINRMYTEGIGRLLQGNESKWLKLAKKRMEKEWNRLQKG